MRIPYEIMPLRHRGTEGRKESVIVIEGKRKIVSYLFCLPPILFSVLSVAKLCA